MHIHILQKTTCLCLLIVLSNIWVLLQMHILSRTITLQSLGIYLQVISMFYHECSCMLSQNIT